MQDILYLSSLNPITIEHSPSDLTTSFAKSLSGSIAFRRGQRILAKERYGLGQALVYGNIGKRFLDIPIVAKARLYIGSIPGCNLLKEQARYSLIDSIILLLTCNTFLDVRYTEIKDLPLYRYVSGKEEITRVVNKYPLRELGAILIPHHATKAELLTWIKGNWDEIEEGNQKLGNFVTKDIPKNIELGVTIGRLRDEGKTFSEIENILFEQNPGDERLAGDQVKVIYARYKKYMIQSLKSVVKMLFLSQ